jgi:hypothetical protein
VRAWPSTLLVLPAVPLVALAAALRNRLGTASLGSARPPSTLVSAVLAAVWVVGAFGMVALFARKPHRRRKGEPPRVILGWRPGKRAQVAAVLFVLALIAAPVGLFIAGRQGGAPAQQASSPSRPTVSHSAAPSTGPPSHGGGSSGLDTNTVLGLVGVLVAAGVATVVVSARRRRPSPEQMTPPPAEEAALHEALRRGAAALDTSDDVRVAIVRCYVAMQRSLDETGLPRSPVRTPSELLRVAVEQHLLPAAPATLLTRLFERARFSSDPLTVADRDAARDALHASGVLR